MSLAGEVAAWDEEVTREAERLIKAGTPPYEAIQKATMVVIERRKAEARRRAGVVGERLDKYGD